MTEPTLFIVAGEPSGDRLGADLITRLRARQPVRIMGVGGRAMIAEGLASLFPMADLSVMGYADVAARMPLLRQRLDQTLAAIHSTQPHCVVLIDSQEFSNAIATRLRTDGFQGTILLYVAPTIGIWRPERAAAIRPLYDEVLAVFPGDAQRMVELGGPPTSYVGHPAARDIKPNPMPEQDGPILLLPGSRTGELTRHLPWMRAVSTDLGTRDPALRFVIPTLPELVRDLSEATASWPVPPSVVTGIERDTAFASARLAVAVVGTVTLELALHGVPMVVCYQLDEGQAGYYRADNPQKLALPNIILDQWIVPECVSANDDPAAVCSAAAALMSDEKAKAAQRTAFETLSVLLTVGSTDEPAQDPAERVLAHMRRTS